MMARRSGNAALALAAVVGLAALYLPIWLEFAGGPWRREENAHAPIMMAIIAGAAAARALDSPLPSARSSVEWIAGFALYAGGLSLAVAGVALENDFFASSSAPLVCVGMAVALFGRRGAGALAFPLAMTLYLVIWPGWALDALTAPLKMFAAGAAAGLLSAFSLPVAHAGAVIAAGPYQLLIADACAGLNALIALTAVGAVYLQAVKRRGRALWIVAAALIPIAVAANVARIAALSLVTLVFGFDAGLGFLHDFAGLATFALALALVFAVDAAAVALAGAR
jgi:exosortase